MLSVLIVVSLIALQGPDGQVILVSPKHIVSLRAPRSHEHFARGTGCVLLTDDAKLVSVLNRCEDIRKIIEGGTHDDNR
jgi:hypothetical protein